MDICVSNSICHIRGTFNLLSKSHSSTTKSQVDNLPEITNFKHGEDLFKSTIFISVTLANSLISFLNTHFHQFSGKIFRN